MRNNLQGFDELRDVRVQSRNSPGTAREFQRIVFIGDIVSVNGQPAKGIWTATAVGVVARPTPQAKQAIADGARDNIIEMYFDLMQYPKICGEKGDESWMSDTLGMCAFERQLPADRRNARASRRASDVVCHRTWSHAAGRGPGQAFSRDRASGELAGPGNGQRDGSAGHVCGWLSRRGEWIPG
jgi:hypothetical protein